MLPGGDRWYFSREEIENNSPSRQDGIALEEETRLRNSYCTFLKDLGVRLKVNQIVLATAMVLCHRFFLRQSHAKNDRLTIATVCMFIAGKVERATRLDLEQVIIISHEIIHKKTLEPDQKQEVYEEQKELILSGEKLVLSTFNFDVTVELPYSHLTVAIEKYILDDATKAQFPRVAARFVYDSHGTTLCLQYRARHIAGAVFFLAAKYLRMDLESNRERWCQEFDITPIQLEDIRVQMRPVYKKEHVPASKESIGETSNSGDVVHQPVSGDMASTDQCPSSVIEDRPEGIEKDKAESEAGEDSSVGNPAAETSDDVKDKDHLAVAPVAEDHLAVAPVAEDHLAVAPVAEDHLAVAPVAEEYLPELPLEIIEEIFARAPIASLLRFRTTCSAFYYRTFDMQYIYRHVDLSQEIFLRFDNLLHIIDPVAISDRSTAMPSYLKPAALISTCVHCNGLFLFQNRNSFRLTLWNPLLKIVYWIQPMGVLTSHDCYGIGYCPDKRRSYKIVRIYEAVREDEREDEVQVFETETESWRIVHASPLDWKAANLHPGLSVQGKMYWLARSKAHEVPTFIQSFNFSDETFTSVCTLPLNYDPLHTNALSVYNHNRLSLIHQGQNTSAIDVWFTNPLAEEVVAWSLLFTVANQDLPCIRSYYDIGYPVHFLDRNNTLLVLCRERTREQGEDSDDEYDEGSPQIRLYRIGRNGIRERANVANSIFWEHHMCGYVYTPSLVWLN